MILKYQRSLLCINSVIDKSVYCQQIVTNVRNTIHGFKKLHGRSFDDPIVQTERIRLPYELQKMPNGSAGVKVSLYSQNASICSN